MKPLRGGIVLLSLLALTMGATQAQRGKDYFAPDILDRPLGIEPLPNGHVLITDAGGAFYTLTDDALLEVDREGQIVWQYTGDMSFPHSAERLPDGTTLISDTANDRVFRVDQEGEIVWTSDEWGQGSGKLADGSHLRYPNDAELLDNGNLLITDRNNNRVIEVTSEGVLLWQYAVLNRPHNADRLDNGNTLVCNSEDNLVVEVDRQGRVVWSFGENLLDWPRDTDRLPNGNTLVTDTRNGRVLEVTPAGEIIWSFSGLALPYEADRLDNENTLIADNNHKRVIEVNPKGEIVWQFRNFGEDYPAELQNGDFEQDGDGDGLPDNWYPADMNAEGPATFLMDAGVVQHADYSGGIIYEGDGRVSWIQVVAVEPAKTYRFSGFLRADLRQGMIAYQLWFLDEMGGPIGDPITAEPVLQGVTDWQEARAEVLVPEGASAVQFWCRVEAAHGRVWFDNISWEEKGTGGIFLTAGIAVGVLTVGTAAIWLFRRRET